MKKNNQLDELCQHLCVRNKVKHKEFNAALKKATQHFPKENLIPTLHIPQSATDQGFGGFTSVGFYADFLEGSKSLHRWPTNKNGGSMRYIGSVNLGQWPAVFFDATVQKIDKWMNFNPFFYSQMWENFREIDSLCKSESVFWMHLFLDSEFSPYPSQRDCCVVIRNPYNARPSTLKFITKHNESMTNPLPEHFNLPKVFFGKPELRFTLLRQKGVKEPSIKETAANSYLDNLVYGSGGINCFGAPRSQQEPMWPISPHSFPVLRALTPMISFNDAEEDMTYQFYADGFLSGWGDPNVCYGKVEASRT